MTATVCATAKTGAIMRPTAAPAMRIPLFRCDAPMLFIDPSPVCGENAGMPFSISHHSHIFINKLRRLPKP
ncbi:hypothetical protein AFE_1332 [Acidithiobacillus ferrooxidans ATCC 23270]|uniref:Uncharacterized protein n=1 Tax=Acidithiobacillus ferrooxidans (strain ATCC 23270 / DSM 14882 / CIP 104768 / NCIMB 8455) TaxID=243159 RepID=B7J9D7_ACIF2|nr:hypothetical protein AFE_1332 [Acidithiobacillus ferrooxidans ATCC 23270]